MTTLRITQRKSVIGTRQAQRATLRTLGLKKIGQSVDREDSGPVRGMLRSVAHLISFEEIQAPQAEKPEAKPAPRTAQKSTAKSTTKASTTKTRKPAAKAASGRAKSSAARKTATKATGKKPVRKAAAARGSKTKKAE